MHAEMQALRREIVELRDILRDRASPSIQPSLRSRLRWVRLRLDRSCAADVS